MSSSSTSSPKSFNPLDRIVFIKRVLLFAVDTYSTVLSFASVSPSFHETLRNEQQYGTTKHLFKNLIVAEYSPSSSSSTLRIGVFSTNRYHDSGNSLWRICQGPFEFWIVQSLFSLLDVDTCRVVFCGSEPKRNPLICALSRCSLSTDDLTEKQKIIELFVDYIEEHDLDDCMGKSACELAHTVAARFLPRRRRNDHENDNDDDLELAARIFRICAKADNRALNGMSFQIFARPIVVVASRFDLLPFCSDNKNNIEEPPKGLFVTLFREIERLGTSTLSTAVFNKEVFQAIIRQASSVDLVKFLLSRLDQYRVPPTSTLTDESKWQEVVGGQMNYDPLPATWVTTTVLSSACADTRERTFFDLPMVVSEEERRKVSAQILALIMSSIEKRIGADFLRKQMSIFYVAYEKLPKFGGNIEPQKTPLMHLVAVGDAARIKIFLSFCSHFKDAREFCESLLNQEHPYEKVEGDENSGGGQRVKKRTFNYFRDYENKNTEKKLTQSDEEKNDIVHIQSLIERQCIDELLKESVAYYNLRFE